jgi:hypothetical protein
MFFFCMSWKARHLSFLFLFEGWYLLWGLLHQSLVKIWGRGEFSISDWSCAPLGLVSCQKVKQRMIQKAMSPCHRNCLLEATSHPPNLPSDS